jgi:hypothetical protein
MSNTTKQPKIKITLEEVLRIKRNERPPTEFWDRFDRELRQKTLRALVTEAPWPRRYLRPLLSRFLIAVPLSSVAVIALFFLVIRNSVNIGGPEMPLQHRIVTMGAGPLESARMVASRMESVNRRSMSGHSYTVEQVVSFPGTRFVISVIYSQSRQEADFDMVMTPQILTAASDSNAHYTANPLTSDSPSVAFATAPSVGYF